MKKSAEKFFHFLSSHSAWIFSLLLFFVCYLVYFQNLGEMTIRMWDESRNAVNALEMTQNGNFIVTYYDGVPDMWNTKPPLLIWMIALSMKIFGYTEGALRLPSAVAASATTFLIFFFVKKYTQDIKVAFLSSLVLLTSAGYTGMHAARTGDYDAMLALWVTSYALFYFLFLQNLAKRKYLYFFITFLILAVLTKGIAGMIPLFGLFLYTLYVKKLKNVLLAPSFYCSLLTFLIVTLGYYLLRNHFNPGYVSAVLNNELTGRYLNVNENHVGTFWHYMTGFSRDRFVPWIFIMPLCLLAFFAAKNEKLKRLTVFCLFFSISFFLVISSAKTKLFWYDAPFYPIASILVAVGITSFFNIIIEKLKLQPQVKNFIFYFLMVAFFTIPLKTAVVFAITPPNDAADPVMNYSSYLKDFMLKSKEIKRITFIADGYNAHLLFYTKAANLKGYDIEIKTSAENFGNPEAILTCDQKLGVPLERSYALKPTFTEGDCSAFFTNK